MKSNSHEGDPAELYAKQATGNAASSRPGALNDFIREQATAIVHALKENLEDARCCKEWKAPLSLPFNAASGKRYTRGNMIMLAATMMIKGFSDPRFLTFKQCKERGGHVKVGEKGAAILRPVRFQVPLKEELAAMQTTPQELIGEAGNLTRERITFRALRVFNVAQCEDLRLKPLPGLSPRNWSDDPLLENFLQAYGMQVHHQGDSAYYNPSTDDITMPPKDCFSSAADYYANLAHEAFHSTGHSSREGRLGTPPYSLPVRALEELRAELFSHLVNGYFGLGYPPKTTWPTSRTG